MGWLRWLVGLLAFLIVLALAIYLTVSVDPAERLSGLYFTIQSWLPITLQFNQFLILLAVLSLLLVLLVLAGGAILVAVTTARLAHAHQQAHSHAAAAQKEIRHITDQTLRDQEQLRALGQALTKRLDKRVIVQGLLEAASHLTSTPHADGVVSLWLLNFATETFQFDLGLYCDETFFTQTALQPTEGIFGRVVATQKPLLLTSWEEGLTFLRREKAAQLQTTSGVLLVPMVIENSVLGVLVIFCHPDILKSYEARRPFYETAWETLALGLAIAIQGEVAILDRLTGVHNREYFLKRLVQELERANRYQLPLSLLMIDIDNFKAVNDTLGHPQGDAVLKIIAKLIRKEVRAIDLVGRYGGEEFIIMLPDTGYGDDTAAPAGALIVAERIRKAVDEEFHGMQKPLNLTVSLGVAIRRFPDDRAVDQRELIRLADEQLYRAKTTGKNKVCVATPPHPQTVA